MCARKPGISAESSHKLRRSIVDGRMETGKPVLLLDWDGDGQIPEQPHFRAYDLRLRAGREGRTSRCSWAEKFAYFNKSDPVPMVKSGTGSLCLLCFAAQQAA